ncbi:12646_t:CDS:2, partial [Acaulospora colombiana]
EEENINATTVIYQALYEEPWIPKEEMRGLVYRAISSAMDPCAQSSSSTRNQKLSQIPLQRNSSALARRLTLGLRDVTASSLEWSDPLANQIIDDNSDLVNNLPSLIKKKFMRPARQMVPPNLSIILEMCREFLVGFYQHQAEDIPRLLKHDLSWKESVEILKEVTKEILSTIKDIWDNPAFGPDFVDSLNEGTYVSNVVVPLIRAALKNLPFGGESSFISTYERQSIASKDRRKELDDKVKLWREMNDGLYWTRKGCKPEKEQFGIVGIQVA